MAEKSAKADDAAARAREEKASARAKKPIKQPMNSQRQLKRQRQKLKRLHQRLRRKIRIRKLKRPIRAKLPEEAREAPSPSHNRPRTPNSPRTWTIGSSPKVASRRDPLCRAARPSWRNTPRMRRTQRRPRKPTTARVKRATQSLKHDESHKTTGAR